MEGFTMRKTEQYHIHTLGRTIYFRKRFLELAGTMGTPEYNTLMELQERHPDFELKQWSIAAPKNKKESYKGLTIERMVAFLQWKYGDATEEYQAKKSEFDAIKGFCDDFHKGSSGGNCKSWFIKRYKDEYLNWAKKKAKKDTPTENAAEPTENAAEPNENADKSASTNP